MVTESIQALCKKEVDKVSRCVWKLKLNELVKITPGFMFSEFHNISNFIVPGDNRAISQTCEFFILSDIFQ